MHAIAETIEAYQCSKETSAVPFNGHHPQMRLRLCTVQLVDLFSLCLFSMMPICCLLLTVVIRRHSKALQAHRVASLQQIVELKAASRDARTCGSHRTSWCDSGCWASAFSMV